MTEEEIRQEIYRFLRRNIPQIQMHGGEAEILSVDIERGSVDIQLTGACEGCGLRPMTIEAIKRRMTKEVNGINVVNVQRGYEISTTDNREPEAPF